MLSLCMCVHPSHLNCTYHILTTHVLFYPLYPFVTMLCTDDIFVPIHIFQTVYLNLKLWIIHTMSRAQNIQLFFIQTISLHVYVLHINRFCPQFVSWITVLFVRKNILQHEKTLFCSCCCKYTNRNCSGLSKAQYEYVRFVISCYCKKCIEEIFPFNHFDDECIFLRAISEISASSDIIDRYHSVCKIFNPFEIYEDDSKILEYHGDLDPDKCFLINTHIAYWKHATIKQSNLSITMWIRKVLQTITFLYSTSTLEVYQLISHHCYLTWKILTTGFR